VAWLPIVIYFTSMVRAILSLGSNIEPRQGYVEAMERELAGVFRVPIVRSKLMETQPVSVDGEQPWYINRIISGWYDGAAHDLLFSCAAIERKLGRTRPYDRAPRTADIDILLFGDSVLDSPDLHIPHPALRDRRFCVEGAMEIAPHYVVPGWGITIEQLYGRLAEPVKSQKIIFLTREERQWRSRQ